MTTSTPPSAPIRVVVFDLGKVVLDFDYAIAVRRFLPRTRVSLHTVNEALNGSPLLLAYERGELSTAAFFAEVQRLTGFDGSLAEFETVFGDIFTEITPMTALVPRLKAAGLVTAALSNTNDMAIRHIARTYSFYALLDHQVLSFEHGSMKPEPRLYEVLEARTNSRGPEIFYLDDREENVVAARERGWRAFVHQAPEESIRTMATHGLPVA
ncbi:MAG: HAD family phosphatase [Verrucomicrobiales bacterium]|nr:HAD family phosphatase [Verrucomicrobiales bacterium]MCP5526264.1 HAD family phosphatase [Verrucomicrobiales bacterium]